MALATAGGVLGGTIEGFATTGFAATGGGFVATGAGLAVGVGGAVGVWGMGLPPKSAVKPAGC